jgi:serine/threonine-protein kinase
MSPVLPLVGEELAGYKLYSVLGRGGMSVVYQAEHPRLSSTVALKVLAPELATDDVFRARFLQESRIAASVNHPNVIPIYDTGPCGELLYIAMRYVAGADLRTVLKQRGHLSPSQTLLLVGQAGRALDAAHRHRLVHRDVKPANILIERGADDDPDHVYLADFGITKHALERSGLTATGQFVGTIDYMAPEQIRGKPIDGRTDIYALGCVLYECLTGSVPFRKEADAAVLWAHVEEPPPPPSTLRPDLPPAIDDVIARALAKAPDARYQTCRAMMAAAREALEPVPEERAASEPGGTRPDTVLGALPTTGVADPGKTKPSRVVRPGGTKPSPVMRNISAPPEPQEVPASEPAEGGGAGASGGAPTAADSPAVTGAPETHAPAASPTVSPEARHAGPPGAPPPARPGRRRGWLLAGGGILAVLVAAAIAAWALSQGGGSKSSSSKSTSMKATTNPILQALAATNKSDTAKGYIPPSTCKAEGASMAMCTNPAFGANTVTFQTYGTLTALYNAYLAAIKKVSPGAFHANFGDCTEQQTEGEVSWNHNYQHPRQYSLTQSESGMVKDEQAAGRVFCTFTNGALNIIWTQNDGRLLGDLVGAPHANTWDWWKGVHHSISIPGSGASMSMSSMS